ncbi:HNH endonuclease signature motif containing protein [Phytohabitans flavus]|uniref:HNH endonuclease n=1 Tax=Phytohabitans flavus TaxID=1076124 RepID=A0A6F8XNN8_9ACTN|nr:HNH endonuclease signature motif containing protein [Phytohabitans flavus]BCB75436.1 HNH endonuclease [Phytohabitans flavus]
MAREALEQLSEVVGKCAGASVWTLGDDELVNSLDAVHQALQTLTAAQLHLIREIDGRGLPIAQHASSTAVWLRERHRISIHAAKRLADLARAVDERAALDTALVAGVVNAEQATVIATAVRDLPADLGADVVDEAEAVLIGQAEQFEPTILRKAGERILAHVAPEIADARDAAALQRQEARAWQTRAFQLTRLGDGRVRVTGWLDEAGAATVNAALDPLCAPRHDDEPRTPGQRRADALVEVCDLATRTEQLPDNGGQRPHVMVTVPFELLEQQFGVGMLDTGGRLSPTQVRQLACDAQLIPAVLDGDGQVLDLGRTRRLITGSLRQALELRDRGCAFPGCDRPPRWCDGHHIQSWADGGPTSLENSVLLCGYHHRIIHRGHWTIRLCVEDSRPEFIPPDYVDPRQRPRRNPYHPRT